jgi:hypothetical protein
MTIEIEIQPVSSKDIAEWLRSIATLLEDTKNSHKSKRRLLVMVDDYEKGDC